MTGLLVQDTEYNAFGAVTITTQPYFLGTAVSSVGMTKTAYDTLGRVTSVAVVDSNSMPASSNTADFGASRGGVRTVALTAISYAALQTTSTDNIGRQKREEKNPDGLVVRTTDASGAQIVHQHDAFGNLVRTKDPLGNAVAMDYDVRGRKTVLNDPDAGVVAYCYDALGQLKAQQNSIQRGSHSPAACPSTSGAGTVAATVAGWTTLAYDVLGRMTERLEPDVGASQSGYRSTWTYDTCTTGKGKLCASGTSQGLSRVYAFDNLGRPAASRTNLSGGPTASSGVTYDTVTGRPKNQTYPSGLQLGFEFTARGYLRQVKLLTNVTVQPLPAVPGGTPGASQALGQGYVLWEALSVNAWGKTETYRYGNNVANGAQFNTHTGRLERLTAGSANSVVDQQLSWNSVDQLVTRIDALGDGTAGAGGVPIQVRDDYAHDPLGRLISYQVTGGSAAGSSIVNRTVQMQYNALGMLLYKSDVGNYGYSTQGVANGRPHAVQGIEGPITASYGYDLNGNATTASSGKWRAIRYTGFNLPDSRDAQGNGGIQGSNGSPSYSWQYDESQARIKETRVSGGGARVTWYLHPDNQGGLGFEREESAAGASNRHYLNAGGMTVAVLVTGGNLAALQADGVKPVDAASLPASKLEYWHKDHLGSLIATTDHAGAVTARYSFDPFGKRRQLRGSYDDFGTVVYDWTSDTNAGNDRGITGHEQLDDVGLVHMNGRVFDPTIARFLQADPLIQAPGDLQSYNRYSYCMNNPLTCTDPSGYSWLSDRWHALWNNKLVRTVVIVVAAYYTGGYALDAYASAAGTAATSGFAASSVAAEAWAVEGAAIYNSAYAAAASSVTGGAIAGAAGGFAGSFVGSNGDLKAGVQGAVTGAVSGGINNYYGSRYPASRIVANGAAGGMGAVLRGDSFANGFRTSAIISSLAYLNSQMRNEMIAQSRIDSRNDGTGLSRGLFGDGFKLAGGRFDEAVPDACSPLGCAQGGPGKVAPRRFVWNPTVRIAGRRRARWACGQAAFEPVHMSTGRLPGARN